MAESQMVVDANSWLAMNEDHARFSEALRSIGGIMFDNVACPYRMSEAGSSVWRIVQEALKGQQYNRREKMERKEKRVVGYTFDTAVEDDVRHFYCVKNYSDDSCETIASFSDQQDAVSFVKMKNDFHDKYMQAKAELDKRYGGALKKLADS